MTEKTRSVWLIVALTIIVPLMAMSQGQIQTLVVSGHAGSIPVTQMNGKNYVEVETLARVVNGSLSFSANQVTLTLPSAGGNAAATAAPAGAGGAEFSKEFLRAGIEEMSVIREWHSALTSAIDNQYPVTREGLAQYEAQAMTNLRLLQTAATTDADRKAAQLIANEYQKMRQLSDKYVAKRANMNYIAPGALKNDALDQSIIACGKALGAMAANGQFMDEVTCH
jgi:hypothetical protein